MEALPRYYLPDEQSNSCRKRDPIVILGLSWDNGKENGNYKESRGYIGYILGLSWDNGKENGNYRDYIGVI